MLRDDMNPMQYIVRFLDNDVERTHYTDDRRYFEQLIAQHGHLSELHIQPSVLTPAQQQRLDEIKDAALSAHDASVYVRFGTTESEDTGYFDADKLIDYRRAQIEPQIKSQRKTAEARGVTVNGIHHSGDPSNRQALSEALQAAADSGASTFPTWKDSNGYHADVPVIDIESALRRVGQRRSALIAKEAQYIEAAAAGEVDPLGLDWTTEHD